MRSIQMLYFLEYVSMKKRRHHYVWRHYLRAWSENEQIWCSRNNKIFLSNLMNIGQERDFYRLKDLKIQDVEFIKLLIGEHQSEMLTKLNHGWIELFTAVFKIRETVNDLGISDSDFEEEIEKQIINIGEDFHSSIESGAIKFLEGMLTNDTDFLNDEDSSIEFIHYLCVQYFRTKNIKENVSSAVSKLGPLDIDKVWNILSHIFSTTLGWSIHGERALWNVVIFKNHTNTPFITGDQPVINTYAAFGNEAIERDHLELYYPLSPNKALLLTKKTEYQKVPCKELSETEVAHFNDAIVDLAYEQIYSSSKFQLNQVAEKYNKALQRTSR